MGSRRAVSSEATALIQQNPTLALIERRSSTRLFVDKATSAGQITEAQRTAVLHAASRAPSAGAMMLYSVISIQRQETLDELARLCDDQPFIARAPLVLVFCALLAAIVAGAGIFLFMRRWIRRRGMPGTN